MQTTLDWFKQAVPAPTKKNFNVQYGCHLEEVLEGLEAIKVSGASKVVDDFYLLRSMLKNAADALKQGSLEVVGVDKLELLDAMCDQRVTGTGIAYMAGSDIDGAMAEVDASNFSKFVDGKAVFDENGKIKKGPGFFRPDLTKFI